jgi:hypothetical protein
VDKGVLVAKWFGQFQTLDLNQKLQNQKSPYFLINNPNPNPNPKTLYMKRLHN